MLVRFRKTTLHNGRIRREGEAVELSDHAARIFAREGVILGPGLPSVVPSGQPVSGNPEADEIRTRMSGRRFGRQEYR